MRDSCNGRYILNGKGEPVPEPDLFKWSDWMRNAYRRVVGKDKIGDVKISTVFLGVNYNFGAGPLILWETMIFGGEHDQYQERYSSREEAIAGHRQAVTLVRVSQKTYSITEEKQEDLFRERNRKIKL